MFLPGITCLTACCAHCFSAGCNKGGNPTWPDLPHGFSFTTNILYISQPGAQYKAGVVVTDAAKGDYRASFWDNNVYWKDPDAASLLFPGGLEFDEWKQTGNDTHSSIADPLIMDISAGNWTLRRSSPALRKGFHQIDWQSIGALQ